jgi:hypothetical protein
MTTRYAWAVLSLLLALPSLAAAATLRVPADYPLIQSAINAAASGDVIHVGPGTYVENLVVTGKSVTLIGTSGAEATVVDGGRQGSVLRLAGGVVDGFTLRNGFTGQGAGIFLECEAPTVVRNCVVRDNEAMYVGGVDPDGFGGGIYIQSGTEDFVVEDNVITANYSGGQGGGIVSETWTEAGEIRDNLISGNQSQYTGGGVYLMGGILLRNRIVGNSSWGSAGGVWIGSGACRSNTIVGNTAYSGCGSGVRAEHGVISRNLVVGNHSYGGGGVCCLPSVTLECNDSWGNDGSDYVLGACDTTGRHNFSADPLFCGPADYHLSTGSPCMGLGVCDLIGALPVACGPTATRRVTWGTLKRTYR